MNIISFPACHTAVRLRTLKALALLSLALSAPAGFSQAQVSERRLYMLNDFDNNTNAGFNDFYGDHGMWNYNGGVVTPMFETGPGPHAGLRLAYDLSAASTAGGWWERLGYSYTNPNTPLCNLSAYHEFRFRCRNSGTATTRFYVEFVQGNFEKSKRIEITGVKDIWQDRSILLSSALDGFDLTLMSQMSIVLENAHVTSKTGTLYFNNFCFVGKPEGYTTTDQFLYLLSHKAFNYFVVNANPQSGLVHDVASYRTVSSTAGVGFQLAALGIGDRSSPVSSPNAGFLSNFSGVRSMVCRRRIGGTIPCWRPAGENSVTFDGSGLPTGTYFCRLESEGKVETKRLLLLK